jgi:hypothetical protein
MVREYGIEHTAQRIGIEQVEDQELRLLFKRYQNLCDDIQSKLFSDQMKWYQTKKVEEF